MTDQLPTRARVVVIGGGVIGSSVAYHLGQLGWSDVLLLEQGTLSCGTTWHAAGLVGQLRSTSSLTKLIGYSTDLYERLESETGSATGWMRCGSVQVARTPERMTQIRRTAALARAYGVDAELVGPREAGQLWPVMRTDDLVGGVWLPGDGKANPTDLTQALAKGARASGVTVRERTKVTGIAVDEGRVTSVSTDAGDVECEIVVNCAGQWAKAVGAMAGVAVPLHSAEHYYVVTDPIDGVHRELPILRDPDGYTYFKEEVGGLVVGGFEPDAKPWVGPFDIPEPFEFQLLDEDWDQFSILMENAVVRVPALDHTGIRKLYNGPESFTPDNNFLLGEVPEVRNFFVGCGLNSMGIASAGGLGLALAEWIVDGSPTVDVWPVDIRRFARFNDNETWLHDRVKETLGLHYAMPWPNRELDSARPLRRSPVHHLVGAAGAVFGSKMGWERVNVFAPKGEKTQMEYSYGRQNWFEWSAAEHAATRERVSLFDQSSFSKLVLKGHDSEAVLQYACTNDVAVPVGRTIYTGMLNERAGYESDFTVTRTAEDEFLIVTGSAQTTRDFDVLSRLIPEGSRAALVDVTSAYAVFGVMGPRARDLLTTVSTADLSDDAFAFGTSALIDLGYATCRATRVTYVGELGWELYVPTEFAVTVWEELTSAGEDLGLTLGGYYAIESLRLEKAYRAWGRELDPETTPAEAGLRFACKLGTDVDFRGRTALEEQIERGVHRRLVQFVSEDPDAVMWGDELILRDGVPVGHVTSAAYGHTVGGAVALGYVVDDEAVVDAAYVKAGSYEINVGGSLVPVRAGLRAAYDPDSSAVRS